MADMEEADLYSTSRTGFTLPRPAPAPMSYREDVPGARGYPPMQGGAYCPNPGGHMPTPQHYPDSSRTSYLKQRSDSSAVSGGTGRGDLSAAGSGRVAGRLGDSLPVPNPHATLTDADLYNSGCPVPRSGDGGYRGPQVGRAPPMQGSGMHLPPSVAYMDRHGGGGVHDPPRPVPRLQEHQGQHYSHQDPYRPVHGGGGGHQPAAGTVSMPDYNGRSARGPGDYPHAVPNRYQIAGVDSGSIGINGGSSGGGGSSGAHYRDQYYDESCGYHEQQRRVKHLSHDRPVIYEHSVASSPPYVHGPTSRFPDAAHAAGSRDRRSGSGSDYPATSPGEFRPEPEPRNTDSTKQDRSYSSSSNDLQRKKVELEGQEEDINQQKKLLARDKEHQLASWREVREREACVQNREAELDRKSGELEKKEALFTARQEEYASWEKQRLKVLEDNDRLKKEVMGKETTKSDLIREIAALEKRRDELKLQVDQMDALRGRTQKSGVTEPVDGQLPSVQGIVSSHPVPVSRDRQTEQPSSGAAVTQPSPVATCTINAGLPLVTNPVQATVGSTHTQLSHSSTSPRASTAVSSATSTTRASSSLLSALTSVPENEGLSPAIQAMCINGTLDSGNQRDIDELIAEQARYFENLSATKESEAVARQLQKDEDRQTSVHIAETMVQEQRDEEQRLEQEKKERELNDRRMAQAMADEEEREQQRLNRITREAAERLATEAAIEQSRGQATVAAPSQPEGIEAIRSRLARCGPT